MKERFITVLIGSLIALLGMTVIVGWYAHIPALVSIVPGSINMVFNTALCFVIAAGLALLIAVLHPLLTRKAFTITGIFLLIISGLSLDQAIFGHSLGIDQFFVKSWHVDGNPFPGRMGRNTATAFLLAGLCFLLIPLIRKKTSAFITQILIFLIFLLGMSALFGYLFNLEFLYNWYHYTWMAIHTAIGMMLLAISLWIQWNKHKKNYISTKDMKIKKSYY